MKINQNILAKAAILAMVFGFSIGFQALEAKAQSKIDVTVSNLETTSRLAIIADESVQTKSSMPNAASDVVRSEAAELRSTADKIASSFSAAAIEKGAVRVAVPASADGLALVDEENLNVKVSYDARPIGGILNIEVSITPSFRGVGVATRPTISRSAARAVDELNDATVQEVVRELTLELQTEFTLQNSRELSTK